ncbi:MAG TPA: hypothetical protein VFF70_03825 [Anaerolineae bacterium]|nr:hypothetical protein [Anaerolineae bacterium]
MHNRRAIRWYNIDTTLVIGGQGDVHPQSRLQHIDRSTAAYSILQRRGDDKLILIDGGIHA